MWIWIVVSAVGGMAIATQALINWRLSHSAGHPLLAAVISFAVGLLTLLAVVAVQPAATLRNQHLSTAPWWAFIGGTLGAFYIVMSIYLIPRIGAAALLSAVVMGQLVLSLLADHFGFFGIARHAVSIPRLVGTALVVVGVVLVRLY
jgi:bacterial/archaeal transporter family-2 protein